MANHTKTITLTDVQQQILSNDLYNDTDNAGIDKWIQDAIDGKINNCWKRMQRSWTDKLMNDSSFTDPIPSNQAEAATKEWKKMTKPPLCIVLEKNILWKGPK